MFLCAGDTVDVLDDLLEVAKYVVLFRVSFIYISVVIFLLLVY